jgi:hypothetical protein
MVQILPAIQRPRKKSFGEQLSAGVGSALDVYEEHYYREKENEALKAKGVDLSGIRDPHTRSQVLAQELQEGKRSKLANASIGANEDLNYSRKEMPEFNTGIKKQPIDLDDITQKNRGSIPQTETSGEKVPVLSPNQLKQKAIETARFLTESGSPTSVEQAYQQQLVENNERQLHNDRVDADKTRVINAQKEYGNKAVEKLLNVLPNANDEQIALFRKKGQEAAMDGEDEARIDRTMAEDARKYKNTIANVKRSLGPERFGSTQSILGKSRDSEKKRLDLRLKLSPLLDEGQFDTARNLLSELGYGPEERESIITDLPESARKSIAEFPKLDKKGKSFPPVTSGKFKFDAPKSSLFEMPTEYTTEQKQLIDTVVSDTLKNDPSTNLILFRSALGNKNVDWSAFKDALNKGIIEGTINLNDDQFNHLELLDEPPLDNLDKILHGLNLIGK